MGTFIAIIFAIAFLFFVYTLFPPIAYAYMTLFVLALFTGQFSSPV